MIWLSQAKAAQNLPKRVLESIQEDVTEVIGTEGKVSINLNPQSSLVNYYHSGGITRDVPPHYYGRFEMAFVKEANEFTAACLDNTTIPFGLDNAVKAVEIGAWLQEALITGKQIHFNENGQRFEKANM